MSQARKFSAELKDVGQWEVGNVGVSLTARRETPAVKL